MKKRGKGHQKRDKARRAIGLVLHKLKTYVKIKFANKFMLFQEILEFAGCH
jgi:hypothetical protein